MRNDSNIDCVIVKGNPKFIKGNRLANNYYNEIADYLKKLDVTVHFDAGEDFTCPDPMADFYIGHSRGVGRETRCLEPEDRWRFLRFGVADGIIHPKDKESLKDWDKDRDSYVPPKEHYIFIPDQKVAVREIITKIKKIK